MTRTSWIVPAATGTIHDVRVIQRMKDLGFVF